MKVKKYRLIAISIFTMLFFVWIVIICFFDFPIKTNNIEAMVVLILSLSMTYIVRNRKDLMISMLCIAYTNYSIVVGCYFDTKIRPSWLYNQFQDDRIYGICITSLLIFELTLLFGWYLFECDRNTITSNIDSFPKNNLIMLGCALVYCVIFLTQVRFYENERASSNPLNEYKTIFLIVGSLYSENTNRNRIIWTALVGASSVATFLGGNRVNTLCNIFVLAVLWYEKQITFKRVVCISIPAIFIMLMIGEMRNNFILSIEAIKSVWENVKQNKLVADSFTFAYGPTIAATELGFGLPIGEKLELLAQKLINIFYKTKTGSIAASGFLFVLIPSRYLAKADCRAKPGGAYFLSVGDTVFSPPTTDARLTIQFISLPTFHLEVRRILVFLIKLPPS